jgi:signal transduction histidine kinase
VKSRGFLFFFVLPFVSVLLLFFVLSALNRTYIRAKTEELVHEQLQASARIIALGVRHDLEDGVGPGGILDRYESEDNVYFMALLDARESVVDWISRFEGYLPFSRKSIPAGGTWTIDSPAGPILNVYMPLTVKSGERYALYLGYSLRSLEAMTARSRANFLLLFGALAVVGLLFFRGIYALHRGSLLRAEEAVAEKKEKERYKALSGFTAGIAHEIKNPLNGLALLFEKFMKKAPADLREDLAHGDAEVRKISDIIDRFSDSVRPLSLAKTDVRLDEVLGEVRSALETDSQAKSVPIRVSTKGADRLWADRELLRQALLNLVRNALDATARGEVRVSTEYAGRFVRIRVEDTGAGLPPGAPDRLFEPFFSTKAAGMGVGLYLVRKIAEAHGGTVSAAPRPKGGASFVLEIPRGSS